MSDVFFAAGTVVTLAATIYLWVTTRRFLQRAKSVRSLRDWDLAGETRRQVWEMAVTRWLMIVSCALFVLGLLTS